MKIKTLLIAVVMIVGLAATASASTQWTVGASPEPVRVSTGYTEKVGAISFNTVDNPGVTVTGTITIDYKYTITVPETAITITTFCGITSPCVGAPDLTAEIDTDKKKVIITVVPVDPTVVDYGFVLDGVRIDVTGLIGAAAFFDINVQATVTASGNQITNGQANALVLQRIMPPFASFTNTTAKPASIINGIASTAIKLTAVENFRNAFWQTMTTDPTQNNVQVIYLTPKVAIPAGITITFPATDSTGLWTLGTPNYLGSSTTPALAYNGTVYYTLTSDTDVTAVENFILNNVLVKAETAVQRGSVYPVNTQVFLQVDLGPKPNAGATNIPRYLSAPLASAISAIEFTQDATKTVLMVPYASNQAGFDTGLAVVNTTLDPFEDGNLDGTLDSMFNTVIDGAIAQTGKIVFYLYPNQGDPFMVSTATDVGDDGIPAKELDDAGMLPAGRTYSVLLSQLVAAGGYDADTFEGYLLIVCDFTNAHGQYFVTDEDFEGFSNGALMLVVDSRYRGANVPETFGQ